MSYHSCGYYKMYLMFVQNMQIWFDGMWRYLLSGFRVTSVVFLRLILDIEWIQFKDKTRIRPAHLSPVFSTEWNIFWHSQIQTNIKRKRKDYTKRINKIFWIKRIINIPNLWNKGILISFFYIFGICFYFILCLNFLSFQDWL